MSLGQRSGLLHLLCLLLVLQFPCLPRCWLQSQQPDLDLVSPQFQGLPKVGLLLQRLMLVAQHAWQHLDLEGMASQQAQHCWGQLCWALPCPHWIRELSYLLHVHCC